MRVSRELAAVDVVLALALAAGAQLEICAPKLVPAVVNDVTGDRPILAVTALVATLPLIARQRSPVVVLALVTGAMGLQQILTTTTPTEGLILLISALVAAYSSSAYSSTPRAAIAGAVLMGGSAFIGEDAADWAFIAILLGSAWLVGFIAQQRSTDLSRAQEDNNDLAERLSDAATQLAQAQRRLATGPATEELAALTAREVEVARVATGKLNAEIAAELLISEWTIKTHVSSILRKLGLRDRAQIVVAAYESGLVEPG